MRYPRKSVLLVVFLTLPSCDLLRKEAERTKAQLTGLAKDAGAGDAVEAVGTAYKENVVPVVAPVTNLADTAVKNVESVAAINSAITSVAEQASEVQLQAEHYSNQVTRGMPKSEREVVSTVNYYQSRFAKWLSSINPNFGRPMSRGNIKSENRNNNKK